MMQGGRVAEIMFFKKVFIYQEKLFEEANYLRIQYILPKFGHSEAISKIT